MLDTLDRAERLTAVLFVVFLVTLASTVAIDDPIGWLLWGVGTILIVGSVLILVNRSTSYE